MTRTSLPIWFLAVISCLSPFGVAIMAPLIPPLAKLLGRPITDLQFLVSAYVLGLAVTQPLVGMASDYLGRRRVLLMGFTFFVLASLGLTLSDGFWPLVVFRFLQAMGAGVGTVIARGLITDQLPPRAALGAFATLTAAMGFTPIVAPVVAGYLVTVAPVRAVFALLVLLGLLVLAGSWLLIPATTAHKNRVALDTYLAGYRKLLGSSVFWSYTLGFGFLQGMFFALLACAALLFEQQFGIGVDRFSLIWSGLACVYIVGSTLLSRFALFGQHGVQTRCVLALALVCLMAPALIAGAGLQLFTLLLTLAPLMFLSGLLTPGTMLGAVNAVPQYSGAAAGLSSAGGMCIAAAFTYLGSWAYDGRPESVVGVVAASGLGFAISWWLAQRLQRQQGGLTV